MHALTRWLTLISIAPLFGACGDGGKNRVAANTHTIKVARNVQLMLAKSGECPEQMENWYRENEREPLRQTITVQNEDFWLTLVCERDLSFSVILKYDFDSGTYVSGREKGALEIMYGHFSDSRTLEILPTDEPVAIAERVVNERW